MNRMTKASNTISVIEFECRGHRIALPLDRVRRAIPSAELLPLPGTGPAVLGMLNLGGDAVAVLDLAHRLGLGQSVVQPAQQFLVAELPGLVCGVVVDRIIGVAERTLEGAVPDSLHAAPFVAGVVRLDDGLCLIVDPERVLFPEERQALERALARGCDGDD